MSTQKVSITISKEILSLIDTASKELKISRSRFVSLVLKEKLLENRKRKIQEAYDSVFADSVIRKEQFDTSKWFEGLEDREGQEW